MDAIVNATATAALVVANLFAPVLPAPLQMEVPSIVVVQQNPYAELAYYDQTKQERYRAYAALHSELSIEDIVWRVNAELDHDFYTDILPVEDPTAMPVIVNKYHQLPASYVPDDLVPLPSGKLATKDTCEAYRRMAADARKEGLGLYAASAYRSYEVQERLYNNYLKRDGGNVALVDTYSARPGHSEHQTGRAIDLSAASGSLNGFGSTPEAAWVKKNCYKYGFIVRYQQDIVALTGYKYEPWHITYVSEAVSQDMHDRGITCLEEYVVKYIDNQPTTTI